jgi:RHS repeat-associated protein
LFSVVNDPSNPSLALTTQYSNYNGFGIPQKVTISANDIQNRVSETNYDATGRFITKTINGLGNTEEFTYDPKYGSVLTKKNISGLMSYFMYDGLGRLIKTKLPDNTINTISYDYVPLSSSTSVYSKTVRNEGEPYFTSFYNHLGNVTGTQTQDVNGKTVVTENKYDYLTGYLTQSSEPHFQNPNDQPNYLTNVFTYEPIFGRLIKKELFSSTAVNPPSIPVLTTQKVFTSYSYNKVSNDYSNGLYNYIQGSYAVTDQTNKQIIKTNNTVGQLLSVKNYEGFDSGPGGINPIIPDIPDYQITNYEYHNNGQPKNIRLSSTANPTPIEHKLDYNLLDQQIQLIDPTAGTINYSYNKLGELLHQDDPNGSYDYVYDNLGRIVTKTGSSSGITNYQYITGVNGKNQIEKISGQNVTTEFTYDALGRATMYKETVAGATPKTFTTLADYDKYSNIIKLTYPSGFITKYNYSTDGVLTRMTDAGNNTIWQLNNQNAIGQITDYTYGNGINTIVNYTNLHNLSSIVHGNIFKQEYVFDPLKGNLNQRDFYNYNTGKHNREKFVFDGLDRLRQSKQVDPLAFDATIQTNNIGIDEKGNILSKDDAGDYVYNDPVKPFNLTQINNPKSNISLNTLSMTYNDINKVSVLLEANTNKQQTFTYGNDDERIKVAYEIDGVNQYTRYYQSGYEKEETITNTKEWTYIYAPTGLAAVYYISSTSNSGQLLYALTDHLGSPVLLTDASQQIQEEYSFDSWGRRRNPADWSYVNVPQSTILNRGYTFHEHIDEFKLINMNGRIYDPVLGRFLAPDNQVQNPDFLQTYNKYAYVFNNPLGYTDPSGWAGDSPLYNSPYIGGTTSYLFNTPDGGLGKTNGAYGGTGAASESIMDLIVNHQTNLSVPGPGSSGNGPSYGTAGNGPSYGTAAKGTSISNNVGGIKVIRDGNISFTFVNNSGLENNFVPPAEKSINSSPQVIVDQSTESVGISEPSPLVRIIPVVGNGWEAAHHFSNGNYWRGAGYTALAISDVFLVKSLYTAAVKGAVMLFTKSAAKEVSQMGFKELQTLTRTYSTEMNAFFKSGGTQVASKEALQAYKELATRMLNNTGGAYQRVTEAAAKLHTQRIELINKALEGLK